MSDNFWLPCTLPYSVAQFSRSLKNTHYNYSKSNEYNKNKTNFEQLYRNSIIDTLLRSFHRQWRIQTANAREATDRSNISTKRLLNRET